MSTAVVAAADTEAATVAEAGSDGTTANGTVRHTGLVGHIGRAHPARGMVL